MATAVVFLPFPSPKLSPNARQHWVILARAKKSARTQAAWQLKADGIGQINADALHVKVTFFPPDNRRRDLDNMIAASKALLDGVSDVVGIDDSKWTISASKAPPIMPNGQIRIDLEWMEREAAA